MCCAGSATRWGNYLGVPKHLVPVDDNVPLIKRTTDQLRARDFTDIIITGFDARYNVAGAVAAPVASILPDTGIGFSSAFWSETGTTRVLLGDVYFSESAMDSIAQPRDNEVIWYGRRDKGSLNKYGEMFGVSIPLARQTAVRMACARVIMLRNEHTINRITGWELYAVCNGLDPTIVAPVPNWINIDDETEDFDFPEEYEAWMRKHRHAARSTRAGRRCGHGLPWGVCCQRRS